MTSNESKQCSRTPAPSSSVLTLDLAYVPLTENKIRGQHWGVKHREKLKAMNALSLALSVSVSDFLIRKTFTDQQNALQTAFAKSVSYLVIRRRKSTFRSRRKR